MIRILFVIKEVFSGKEQALNIFLLYFVIIYQKREWWRNYFKPIFGNRKSHIIKTESSIAVKTGVESPPNIFKLSNSRCVSFVYQ